MSRIRFMTCHFLLLAVVALPAMSQERPKPVGAA